MIKDDLYYICKKEYRQILKDQIYPSDKDNKSKEPKSKIISEKWLEKELSKIVKPFNGLSIKLLPSLSGLPDRLVLFPKGRLLFAEIKTTGKKPRKLQLYWHKKLRELGFVVVVIDSLEGLEYVKVYASEISGESL